jgi:hypothetical protein
MSRLEQGAVIRYLTLKNLSPAEIATELQSVHGTDGLFDLACSGRLSRRDLATPI